MVAPGLAGLETTLTLHDAARIGHPDARWGITTGIPCTTTSARSQRRPMSTFALDVIIDRQPRDHTAFGGDILEMHRVACESARSVCMREVPERFDLVVTSNAGFPLDQNLYQAVKGMSAAAQVVRPGGTIVCVAECRDGFPDHGSYRSELTAASSVDELLQSIVTRERTIPDQWQIQIQANDHVTCPGRSCTRASSRTPTSQRRTSSRRTMSRELDPRSRVATRRICVLPEGPLTVPVRRRSRADRCQARRPERVQACQQVDGGNVLGDLLRRGRAEEHAHDRRVWRARTRRRASPAPRRVASPSCDQRLGRGERVGPAADPPSSPAIRPVVPASPYFPLSAPNARLADATTPAPASASAAVIAGSSDPRSRDEAVGKLHRARPGHAQRLRGARRLGDLLGLPVGDAPGARLAASITLGDLARRPRRPRAPRAAGMRTRRRCGRTSFARASPSISSSRALGRARTPTTACSRRPSRRGSSRRRGTARRTAPRSTRRQRRGARVVVVARVVEERDPGVARGLHDGERLLARDALERPPGAERHDRDVHTRAAEGASIHAGIVRVACVGALISHNPD